MLHRLLCLTLLAGGLCTSAAAQHAWVQNPANGHWYTRTVAKQDWLQAQAEAVLLGGNLVVLDDAAENSWVHATFVVSGVALAEYGPWIGYFQDLQSSQYSEPGGAWTWVLPGSTYSAWDPGEPNDGYGGGQEDYAHYIYTFTNKWNDCPLGQSGGLYGIVERDTAPGLVLHVDDLVTGSAVQVRVAGAGAGDLIGVGYSLAGPGPISFPTLPGLVLELGQPYFVLGIGLADGKGLVTMASPPIPPGLTGLPVWFDAVELLSPYPSAPGVLRLIQ